MRRFRVPLIFRRSTTSCPATCRCRSMKRTPTTIRATLKKHTSGAGVWSNFGNFSTSLLKAWYGDAATKENDYCFDLLPRVTGDHSHFGYWLDMQDGNDPTHTSVGGLHAAFIVRGDPKQYNLPP